MKDLKEYKLDDEILKNVSGGAGEDWSEIARRMMENSNEQLDDSSQNQSNPEPFSRIRKKRKVNCISKKHRRNTNNDTSRILPGINEWRMEVCCKGV